MLKSLLPHITPLTQRRIDHFKQNRRGLWSLWIFSFIFALTLFAEFIANDKPLVLSYDHELYFPIFKSYPETVFGGDFEAETNYRDPYVRKLIDKKGSNSRSMI